MTRVAKATCKFCGIDYSWLMSGYWFRGTKDTRSRSSSLCPDCYEKVMNGIKKWCEQHSHRNSNLFIEKLFKKRLSPQAVLAVLVAIDEVCTICWDGEKDCVCAKDI